MGAWTGIGQIGQAIGLARDLNRQRQLQELYGQIAQQEMAQRAQQLELQKRREQFSEAEAQKPYPIGSPIKAADGSMTMAMFDPRTGQYSWQKLPISAMTKGQEQMQELEQILGHPPTPEQREMFAGVRREPTEAKPTLQKLSNGEYVWFEPGKPPVRTGLKGPLPKSETTGATGTTDEIASLAQFAHETGILPTGKIKDAVMGFMQKNHIPLGGKFGGTEQRTIDSIKQSQGKVDELMKILEPIKDQNDVLIGPNSAAAQHAKVLLYKFGASPGALNERIIQFSAAIQVMAAAPWMQGRQSKYMFETVKQHLPNPTDNPALMYQKLTFIRDLLADGLKNMMEAPRTTGTLGEGAVQGQEEEQIPEYVRDPTTHKLVLKQ